MKFVIVSPPLLFKEGAPPSKEPSALPTKSPTQLHHFQTRSGEIHAAQLRLTNHDKHVQYKCRAPLKPTSPPQLLEILT